MKWKNIAESGRPYMKTWSMRTAYWIPKATKAHSEYVIFFFFSTVTMVARTLLDATLSCLVRFYSCP